MTNRQYSRGQKGVLPQVCNDCSIVILSKELKNEICVRVRGCGYFCVCVILKPWDQSFLFKWYVLAYFPGVIYSVPLRGSLPLVLLATGSVFKQQCFYFSLFVRTVLRHRPGIAGCYTAYREPHGINVGLSRYAAFWFRAHFLTCTACSLLLIKKELGSIKNLCQFG